MKKIVLPAVVLILLVGGFFALNSFIYNEKQADTATNYKDASYVIDGKRIQLEEGVSEIPSAPGSASKIVTRYFGNEVRTDLNGDSREDIVFLLTQETGGSGLFYYVVAAVNTENGYIGSEAILLGDRIAPQTTEVSQNPNHKGVIVVNYADRAQGEPMTASPSEGNSIWLKLDAESLQFGEVVQNFEGEADPSRMTLGMKKWQWVRAQYNDGREIVPRTPNRFTLEFKTDGSFSASTDCNGVGGEYTVSNNTISFERMVQTLMYCEGSQESEYVKLLSDSSSYHFTSKGELVLSLKFDSGSVIFR